MFINIIKKFNFIIKIIIKNPLIKHMVKSNEISFEQTCSEDKSCIIQQRWRRLDWSIRDSG